jgi:hypothetical protein
MKPKRYWLVINQLGERTGAPPGTVEGTADFIGNTMVSGLFLSYFD